jgi:hypothetical protein
MTAKLLRVTMQNGDSLHFAPEQFVSVRAIPEDERRDLASIARLKTYAARSELTLINGSPLHVLENNLQIVEWIEEARKNG